jgi:hypothetical protein
MELSSRMSRASARALLAALLALLACAPSSAHAGGTPNSADRLIIWTKCTDLPKLSDADLDSWKARGVDGFACMTQHLAELGGSDAFDPDLRADLSGDQYALERSLIDSRVGERLRDRGMRAYLGVYLSNYWNDQTPLADWFDDESWSGKVLPRMRQLAGTAKALGFEGVAFDQELYPTDGGRTTATWQWDYPGNHHSEREVRAAARRRGAQLMRTLAGAFPDLDIMAYDVQLPGSWNEVVQRAANGTVRALDDRLDIDFLDGMAGEDGYGNIRLVDATFYKTPHYGTWDTALRYEYNSLYASLSRHMDNWDKLADHLDVSPFGWVDQGPCRCGFDDVRAPGYVADQLAAFRRWGMGGEFGIFAYAGLDGFDYAPYDGAMRAASKPAVVDSEPPRLDAPDLVRARGSRVSLGDDVADNTAVRVVRWRTNEGRSGVAQLDWRIEGGSPSEGYHGKTRWSLRLGLRPGESRVTITAEDTKGLTTRRSVAIKWSGRFKRRPAARHR